MEIGDIDDVWKLKLHVVLENTGYWIINIRTII